VSGRRERSRGGLADEEGHREVAAATSLRHATISPLPPAVRR
jgi:hypothetical protein